MNQLGIVTALPGEARILARRKCKPLSSLRLAGDVHLTLSGMGVMAAQRAAQYLVDSGARALVSWGCAGGLDANLSAGTLLLPSRVVDVDGQSYCVDMQWRERIAQMLGGVCEEGILLTTNQPLGSARVKAQWRTQTQAVAVDMESAGVAAIAQANNLPFLVVRAIADSADTSVPPAALKALSESGDLQPLAILTELAKKPSQIPELLALGRSFRKAQASLAQVVERAGARLAAA